MSKVISFSISDKYLDKLRSLYPALTDNLAAKQFLTDRLDGSLGSGLDAILDDGLDGKLKSLIESELDGILEGRLDATVGKSLTSLSERMARLEARLDDSLDGSLDVKLDYGLPYQPSKNELTDTQRRVLESRQLTKAKLEHAAYLVKHPLVVRDLTKKQPIETVTDTVESVDESDTSPIPNQETVEIADTVEPDSIDEPVTGSIGPVGGDSDSIDTGKGEGMNPNQAHEYLISKGIENISYYYLNKWAKDGVIDTSPKGKKVQKHLKLRDKLYYPID